MQTQGCQWMMPRWIVLVPLANGVVIKDILNEQCCEEQVLSRAFGGTNFIA